MVEHEVVIIINFEFANVFADAFRPGEIERSSAIQRNLPALPDLPAIKIWKGACTRNGMLG